MPVVAMTYGQSISVRRILIGTAGCSDWKVLRILLVLWPGVGILTVGGLRLSKRL